MGQSGGATVFSGKPSSFVGCTGDPTELVLPHSQFYKSQ